MGFSRQEYWRGSPCPPPGDLPHPGIEPASPVSPALQAGSFPAEPSGKPCGSKAGLCGGPVSHLRGRKITAGNPQVTHAQPGRRAGGWRGTVSVLHKQRFPFCRAGDTVSAAGGLRPGGAVRGAAVLGGLRAAHRHVPGRPSSARAR